jgi:hypothetical protein
MVVPARVQISAVVALDTFVVMGGVILLVKHTLIALKTVVVVLLLMLQAAQDHYKVVKINHVAVAMFAKAQLVVGFVRPLIMAVVIAVVRDVVVLKDILDSNAHPLPMDNAIVMMQLLTVQVQPLLMQEVAVK